MTERHPRTILTRPFSPAEASVVIPVGRPDVYAMIEDPTTYPDWLAGARHVRAVDPEFPKAGSGFDHEVGPSEDITIADDTVAEGASPPERLDLEVHAGAFTGQFEFHLHAVVDGTKVVLRERAAGSLRPVDAVTAIPAVPPQPGITAQAQCPVCCTRPLELTTLRRWERARSLERDRCQIRFRLPPSTREVAQGVVMSTRIAMRRSEGP